MVTSIVERALLRIPDRCEEIPCVSIRLRGGEPEPRELINTGEEGPMAEAFPSFDYEAARSGRALDVADDFNFAFDVVGKRGREKDKTALIAIERTGETVTHHSYSDLDQLSNRFANALMTLGAEKGDFAFVMIPRIVEWYQVLLGCTKTGVVAMPGTNLLTAKDIEYRINRADARLAIVTAEHAEKVEQIRANCPSLEHLILIGAARDGWVTLTDMCAPEADTVDRAALPPTRADEDMLIYFTSGTTQMPKMVGRDHAYALAHSITGDYWMDLREDDVHWTLTDTGWAKAAWGLLYPPLLAGAAVVLYDGEGFDPEMHLKIIAEHRVTTFCAPPTIYRVLAQMDLSGADFSSLRHCFGAGEPLNPEAMRAWKAATGCDIYDGYGQTESINIVANFTGMEIRAGPVPRLFPRRRGDGGSVPQRLVLHRRHGDAGCGLLYLVCRPVGRHHFVRQLSHQPVRGRKRADRTRSRAGIRRRRQAGRDPRRDRDGLYHAGARLRAVGRSGDRNTGFRETADRPLQIPPRHRIPRRPAEDDIGENPAGGVTGRGG